MESTLTLSQQIWPKARLSASPWKWALRNVTLMVGFSALIGLCAHIQIKLGFTPVPITGQTFAVLLAGALLGPRLGAATLGLYIFEGTVGLPVFPPDGGIVSFGYLVGFTAAAIAVGYLAERGWDRKPLTTAIMMLVGTVLIYAFGVAWLIPFVGGFKTAMLEGVAPFLIGDAVKAAAVAALLPTGWLLLGKRTARSSGNAPA